MYGCVACRQSMGAWRSSNKNCMCITATTTCATWLDGLVFFCVKRFLLHFMDSQTGAAHGAWHNNFEPWNSSPVWMVARARWRLCELHFLFFSIVPLIATNCFEAISSIFKVDYCMEKKRETCYTPSIHMHINLSPESSTTLIQLHCLHICCHKFYSSLTPHTHQFFRCASEIWRV